MKKSNRVVSFLLALTLVTGMMPADAFTFTAYATAQNEKPADGTLTNGEVFPTGVSQNFRIPGLVNFQGNLIASADARWNNEKDGGGMDLVVSRSSDGGATWNYTFAGYLGDNGNEYNANSTTLMDPVIITDGETLYLLADMYPAGYSISSSSTANVFSDTNIGFDAEGRLLLSDDGRSSYGYYLSGNKIYQTDGIVVSGYTVDGWFNLYNADEYVTNLFFADSPYQVRATSYICMMSSSDGKNWSEPTLLNVKPQGVSWMVLGPGSGLVTKDGYIAFTAYDNTNIYLIYGKDGEWNTVKTSAATNESSIIELNDGTIRAFVKRGGNNTIAYVDFTKNNDGSYSATALVDTGVNNFSQCMVSSLHYSRTLEGKEVVLVCCPAKPGSGAWNGRFNGKIFVFTLDENNAMTLVNSHALNGETEFFAYSNMAEMDDGTIAVLYEDDCISYSAGNYTGTRSHITFTTVDLEEELSISFDASDKISIADPDTHKVVNELTVYTFEEPKALTIAGMSAEAQIATAESSDPSTVTATISGTTLTLTPVATGTAKVTVTVTDAVAALDAEGASSTTVIELDVTVADTITQNIEVHVGETITIQDNTGNYAENYTVPNGAFASMGVTGSTTAGKNELEAVTAIESGKQYLLVNNRAGKTLTATTNSPGLLLDGVATVGSPHLWQIDVTGTNNHTDGPQFMCTVRYGTDGNYLNVGYEVASVGSAVTLQLHYITDSNHWLINDEDGNYGLNDYTGAGTIAAGWRDASTDGGSWWTIYEIVERAATNQTTITFTGKAVGNTTAVVGHTTYNITVTEDIRDIILYEGAVWIDTIENVVYGEEDITQKPDEDVVSTVLADKSVGAIRELNAVTEIVSGKQYLIVNYRAESIFREANTVLSSASAPEYYGTTGLQLNGSASVDSTELWTITKTDTSYTITQGDKYLTVGSYSASVSETESSLTLTYEGAKGWLIQSGTNYLSDLYGQAWSGAAGYNDRADDGNYWTIYEIVDILGTSTTQVTFTGITAGTTTAKVGHVTYNITVKKAVDGDIADFTQIVGTKTYSDANGSVALSGKPITKLTIAAGSTFASLGVDIANADAVIWSSEDTGVATVDQNGSVTAVAEGETNISAKVIKDGIAETISIPVRVIPSLIPSGNTAALDESLSYIEVVHCVDVYFSLYGDNDYVQERKQAQIGEVIYFTRPINVAYGIAWTAAPQDTEKYALAYMAATGTEGQYYPLLPAGHDASAKCFCGSNAYSNLFTYYGATEAELNSMLAAALAAHCTGAMSQGRRGDKGVPEPMATSLTFVAEKLPDVSKTLNGILPKSRVAADFRRYTGERMTGEVGDYIYFTIAVIQEAPKVFDPARTDGNYSLVEYTQATLIDTVVQGVGNYYFYTKAQDTNYDGVIDAGDGSGYQQLKEIEIHDDLNTAWTAQEIAAGKRTKAYYVIYEIVDADLPLELDSNGEPKDQIKNSVTFNYSFNSIYDYSKGSTAGAAAAAANTLVVGEYIGEFVVDFGLPLIITVTGAQSGFQYLRKENYVSCKYGTVEVTQTKGADTATFDDDEFTIVYTPTTILPTADEVLLYRTKSDTDEDIVVNSFSVVPASSVYYAAGLKEKTESTKPLFFEKTTDWSWESLVVGPVQNLDTLGDVDSEGKPIKTNPYGYDAAYATMSGLSHDTQLSATAKGAEAVFSFTGTGMEIFANCSATTGTVMVEIWTFDDNGDAVDDSELVWAYLVDTKADATYYGLPIVSVTDLEYDRYVVKLRKTQNDGTVNIDGFRILGTVEENAGNSSLYFYDQEDHPDFYELRDFVLGGMGVQGLNNWRNWYSAILGNQIFNKGDFASGAIVLDAANTSLDVDVENLLMNGPKNELFLRAGQTLVFKVTTDRLMQIGLKAPQGQTNVEVSVTYDGTPVSHKVPASIISSVDMFYELGNENGTERIYTITITNNGPNILSVTKLKICDDPAASFGTLTEEDVANVLVDQGLMPQRTDKDATVRVSLQDYAGNQVGAVTLSKRGADGRRVTFTAAEVLAAARQQMPEGYDFVNKEAVFDVTATYGESREAYVQVGKVATVNITYISLSKRKVYTVTVTKIQFAEGDCQLSVTELMHYSPLGRFLLMMSGITAEYGAETDAVVTVL